MRRGNRGFTLTEILIANGLMVLLTGGFAAFLQASSRKAPSAASI